MSTDTFRRFAELADAPYRLGRHQIHDALLAELEAFEDELAPIEDVVHAEFQPVWDQGNLGSCTMHAAYGCMVTDPYGRPGTTYTEQTIVAGYELETRVDDSQIGGHYPPTDTGSTGAWSMTTLKKLGLIKNWRHTRVFRTALRMLNKGPISIGVPWYKSMFTPDADHTIHLDETSELAGGHQITVVANDTKNKRIRIRNSWGLAWGDDGHCWLSWADFERLLALGGDVVQPVL